MPFVTRPKTPGVTPPKSRITADAAVARGIDQLFGEFLDLDRMLVLLF
jgi:hypothetical protein